MKTTKFCCLWTVLVLIPMMATAQPTTTGYSPKDLQRVISSTSPATSCELADGALLTVDADGAWLTKDSTRRKLENVEGRRFATMTLLPTGKVLIWGGVDDRGSVLQQGLWFDPAKASTSPVTNVSIAPRAGHTATVLLDGRVLISGGWSESHSASDSELWNIRSGKIERVTDQLAFRFAASAELRGDGLVVISGGVGSDAAVARGNAVFDPAAMHFIQNLPASDATRSGVSLQASIPVNEAREVPFGDWIGLRFSQRMSVSSLNAKTLTLLGPNGPNAISVVPTEKGHLAFVQPARDLLPASHYTLFISGAQSDSGEPLPFTTMEFDTRAIAIAPSQGDEGAVSDAPSAAAPDVSDSLSSSSVVQDSAPLAPVSMHLRAGTSRAVAEFTANCANKATLHGYRFCRDKGNVEGGIFTPGAANTEARWRVNAPLPELLAAKDLPASALPAGVTAVFGTVRRIDDRPLAQVTVSIGKTTTRTDKLGRFVLTHVPSGKQLLSVDGHSADRAGEEYGQFVAVLHIEAGQANAVPFNLFIPRITALDKVSISSPTLAETVITHPAIPGFEIHVPVGAVLRDRNGSVVTQLAVVPMPTDRSPVPTPGNFPIYYSTQPEGVTIDGLSVASGVGLRVVYPNYTEETKPGELFWYYDPDHDGWTVYSTGHVSDDQKKLVPDSNVGAPRIMPNGAVADGTPGPGLKCEGGCPPLADPVDGATGIFIHQAQDLELNDGGPVALTRTYVSKDPQKRSFGYGSSNTYGMYLYAPGVSCAHSTNNISELDIATGEGATYPFFAQNGITDPTKALYVHKSTSTKFYGATLRLTNSGRFVLQLVDGSQYWFLFGCPTLLDRTVDRFGNTTLMTYNAGLLSRITTPGGRYFSFEYNGNNEISKVTDNSGRYVTYDYVADRLTKATYLDATMEQYTYDPATGNMRTVVDRKGTTMVTNDYDVNTQRVQKQTYPGPDGYYQFTYVLGGSGNVVTTDAMDTNGITEHLTYDAAGFPLTRTHAYGTPLAQTMTYVRGQDELITSQTDPLGRVTLTTYDTLGNVLTKTYNTTGPRGTSATYNYTYTPDYHQLSTAQDPLGHVTTYGYTNGCLTSVTDALGHGPTIVCNSAGQPVSITDALGTGHTTTLTYFGYDLRTVEDALHRKTTFSTDALGRVISVIDPLGRETRTAYDINGRVAQTTDALNQSTSYLYDGNGNLTSVTDPATGRTQYGYDARNRKISRTDALNKPEYWSYDGMGNVMTYTDRKGQLTQYQHDQLNRLKLVTYFDSSTVTPTFDGGNRLTSIVDTVSGTISRTYDAYDRITQEQTPQGIVNYTYDLAGRRTTMTPASQAQIVYAYDNANRLASIVQSGQGASFFYDNANRRTSLALPNSLTTIYGYDNANELTSMLYQPDSGTLASVTYGYDLAGQRTSKVGGFGSEPLPAPTLAASTFDLNNKQTLWNGYSLGYDLNGDPTSSAATNPATTYTFDVRHRLTQIQQGATTVASFSYDAFNRRTSRTVGGVTTSFLYDGVNTVQETQGATVSAILTGLGVDERFWRDEPAGRRYFATDALGSTVALTDINANVVQTYSYEPYGEVTATGTSANLYQYTGRENDGTGLYYYRARYYSPSLKRFISEDPTGLASGLNEYAYASGDPVSSTDPFGLSSLDLGRQPISEPIWTPTPFPHSQMTDQDYSLLGKWIFDSTQAISQWMACSCHLNQSSVPPLPTVIVGNNPGKTKGRVNTDWPSSGMEELIKKLTGGVLNPHPKIEGGQKCPNGIVIRPGNYPGEGTRIDIPENGDKPRETIHEK